MARYIDADVLKKRLGEIGYEADDLYAMGINRGLDRAETAVDMIPTADVVPRSEDGLILTFDGASGYFPKEFIIEAIRSHMRQGDTEKVLSDLKKEIHDKAVYPEARSVKPYISLKVVDAIINNKMEEFRNEN